MSSTKYGTLPNRDVELPLDGESHVSAVKSDESSIGKYFKFSLVAAVMMLGAFIGTSGFLKGGSSSASDHFTKSKSTTESMIDTSSSKLTTKASNVAAKPNFVFFMADDLAWNSIGYQDFDFGFVTPNLNKFAENGIIINNYYAQEICTPSRTSLFTGRYPANIGQQFGEIMVDQVYGLNLEETLIPEVLGEKGGYKNYMAGKWNMGNSDARYMPTHRGFDQFFGYLGGGINPYTKTPGSSSYIDFMYSDQECYNIYDGDDFGDYSTYLFRNKALDAIKEHDFDSNPMFLYVAFHGVHTPLSDHKNKISGDDIGDELFDEIKNNVYSSGRQKIAAVLALMDQSIKKVYDAMKERGQEDNTYFIFASDNGGCNNSGGFNGPLRGNKGSLFEGGVKVDAMVWGKILPEKVRGTKYDGLMHTSDWFPTMLQLAGITNFAPKEGFELDGISQAAAMLDGRTSDFPRTKMLYNVYVKMAGYDFELDSFTQAAARNEQYKLMYAFLDNDVTKWYDYSSGTTELIGDCDPQTSITGNDFQMMLFDLKNDPYETTNLYGKAEYKKVQDELTADLEAYAAAAVEMPEGTLLGDSTDWFTDNGNFAHPWLATPEESDDWPKLCSKSTVFHST